MTDFPHQQIAERFAKAVKDGNIRFGRVASTGAIGQAIQVRQDSGQMVRAIAQNNCTPGEPCTLLFLDGEVRAYGSNDVATIERSLRYRRHREQVASIEERILALLLYEKPAIAGLLAYLKKETLLGYLSILYETIQEERIACTCPTYNRLGNRCIPVCDGTGQYPTLAACLAAPEPPWPDPVGEDGRGGYLLIWTGHKVGSPGGAGGTPWIYPTGSWNPGTFYYNLAAANPCTKLGFDLVDYIVSSSWYQANSGWFPQGNTIGIWTYISVPAIPKLDNSYYSPNAFVAGFKGTGSTSGSRFATAEGWLAYQGFNMDVWIPEQQTWHSGNMAFGECYVVKYVPSGQLNGQIPTPPSRIGQIDTAGVSLVHNPSQIICSPFNRRPDPSCQDPGQGNAAIACPYPEEKRSRRYWIGGSKQTPVLVHTLHFNDPKEMYLIKTDREKEIVRMLAGKNPAPSQAWCKIIDINVVGNTVSKQIYSNPNFPQTRDKEWKHPLFAYNYPTNNYIAPPYVAGEISKQNSNILIQDNKPFRLAVDLNQSIQPINGELLLPWSKFSDAVKGNYQLKDARICLSPWENNNYLAGKGVLVERVFPLNSSGATIIAASAYILETKLQETYNNSALGCSGSVYRRQYRERYYSGKQEMFRDIGWITYNDRYAPEVSYLPTMRVTIKDCSGQVTQVLAAQFNGTIEPYGQEEILGLCQ